MDCFCRRVPPCPKVGPEKTLCVWRTSWPLGVHSANSTRSSKPRIFRNIGNGFWPSSTTRKRRDPIPPQLTTPRPIADRPSHLAVSHCSEDTPAHPRAVRQRPARRQVNVAPAVPEGGWLV